MKRSNHFPEKPERQPIGAYAKYLADIKWLEKPIVLVGLMGVGKTQLGQALAEKLGLPFRDSDAEIEKVGGLVITEIFDRFGEEKFRELERRVIGEILEGGPMVLATGGGAFVQAATRELINGCAVSVWLRATLDTIVDRTQRSKHRPLLQTENPRAVLAELMEKRYPLYAEATLTVDTDNYSRWQTLDVVLDRLHAYAIAQKTNSGFGSEQ
ncbi:MAG TPA: shikimate kinase [Rhodospirillaceae bacterium]|nr:shikimate kinase [Rhodospirillaceae bacterium]